MRRLSKQFAPGVVRASIAPIIAKFEAGTR